MGNVPWKSRKVPLDTCASACLCCRGHKVPQGARDGQVSCPVCTACCLPLVALTVPPLFSSLVTYRACHCQQNAFLCRSPEERRTPNRTKPGVHVVGSSGGACAGAYLFLDAGGPDKQGRPPATAKSARHCADSLLHRCQLTASAARTPVECAITSTGSCTGSAQARPDRCLPYVCRH